MAIKADLHNHLQTSNDFTRVDFNRVVNVASARLGEGGILGVTNFVTDDSLDNRYETLSTKPGYDRDNKGRALYVPEKKLWIVKSQEVPTLVNGHEVHLLVIGLPEHKHLKPGRPLEDAMKEGRDLGGKLVFDHPGYTHGILPHLNLDLSSRVMPQIDGWEVFNSSAALNFGNLPIVSRAFPPKANERAQNYYAEVIAPSYPHVKPLCSSDGHSLAEIGRAFTKVYHILNGETDSTRLIDEIFEGIPTTGYKDTGLKGSPVRSAMHAAAVIKENGLFNTLGRFVKKE